MIAAGDMVPAKKPAPDIYHLVVETMALPRNRCLVLEDSQQGVLSSVAAGLPTVVTINDYTRNQPMPGASLVISHLGEPSQPFGVLWGEAKDAYYFSLELAQSLLAAS
jgi:beta-phosphoglucomutase-like phosphatase (HAD superfamily)